MRKFNKNIVNEFKTGFGRFVAIMAIIALGVGFLIGIMQATPDMKNSMDSYLRDSAAYDIGVKGAYGLSEEDIAAIEGAKDADGNAVVSQVMPVVSTDAVVNAGGQEIVGRIVGLDFAAVRAGNYLNRFELLEGEYPDAAGEVVVERSNNYFADISVGDTISVAAGGQKQYGDVYALEEYTVVGIVASPDYYFRNGREVTTIGTGVVGTVIYGQAYDSAEGAGDGIYNADLGGGELFDALNGYYKATAGEGDNDGKLLRYTDCWVSLVGSDGYEMFTDGYKSFSLENADLLSSVGTERSAALNADIEELNKMLVMMGQQTIPASAQWYVLDRASTNVSYVSYDMNVEKVEDIAGIFPFFFIVVAALVALTSMTRMVEEDRMQIGTFKALGYSKGRIMSKYLIYCCLASIIGCVAGILIGFSLLPTIFWQAYATMYQLPALQLSFSPWFAVAAFAVALAGTAAVTVFACHASLKESPAKLMQPKAPKPGKRILLERVGFFWNRLKFKWKATVRNIFRYKKNMVLTIISVMGCTALILIGFGLNDSVGAVENIQYKEIIKYDAVIGYDAEEEAGDDACLDEFLSGEGVESVSLYSESGQLIFGDGRESIDLYVVDAADGDALQRFNSLVDLRERKKSAIIDIGTAQGLILPENIAVVYDISAGDTVTYVSAAGQAHEVTVAAVCEYYTGSVAYMNEAFFSSLGESASADNTLFVRSGVTDTGDATERLLSDGRVSSVEFTSDTLETFESLSSTMGLVIAVLVISAGALAAIVLYNLTNINIEERRREIATLRVLGYKHYEVAGYIYRESAILTVVGALLGLLLGFLLHMFIVGRVDSVMMMFGRAIGGLSYLWAFLLTIAFAVIVYAFMLIKLNKIDMAESLKSNE